MVLCQFGFKLYRILVQVCIVYPRVVSFLRRSSLGPIEHSAQSFPPLAQPYLGMF